MSAPDVRSRIWHKYHQGFEDIELSSSHPLNLIPKPSRPPNDVQAYPVPNHPHRLVLRFFVGLVAARSTLET